MKKINVHFEKDEAIEKDTVEILVRAAELDKETEELMQKINSSRRKSIFVTDGNGRVDVIKLSDIILLSVNGKQVSITTDTDRYTARQPLIGIEEQLDPADFVRISRYEIVNLNKVIRYDFTLSGTLRIELAGGIETWASRRCIPQIRSRLAGKE